MFDAIQIINTDPNVARRGTVAVNAGAGYVHVTPDQHSTFTSHGVYNAGCPRLMFAVEYDRYMAAGAGRGADIAVGVADVLGRVSAMAGVPSQVNRRCVT